MSAATMQAPKQELTQEQLQALAQSQADQSRAAKRTELQTMGLALIGPGLTSSRIVWGKELWSYLSAETTEKSRKDCLTQLTLELLAASKGMLDERKLTSSIKLYHLSVSITSLASLNYRIAECFEKIGKLSMKSGVECATTQLVDAQSLALDILAGKQCTNPKTGIIERDAVSRAIDKITGKIRKARSVKASALDAKSVSAWIATLDETAMQSLINSLDKDTAGLLCDCFENYLAPGEAPAQ